MGGVRVEVVGSLREVFAEASKEEGVSALIPLSTSLVFSDDGHWHLFPLSHLSHQLSPQVSYYVHSSPTNSTLNLPPSSSSPYTGVIRTSNHPSTSSGFGGSTGFAPSGFFLPFSLAVRTDRLFQCLLSLSVSGGFPGVLFKILLNRYRDALEDAFGFSDNSHDSHDAIDNPKWSVFFDQSPTLDLSHFVHYNHRFSMKYLLEAKKEFDKRKGDIYQHLDKAANVLISDLTWTNLVVSEAGYYPGILSFLSKNAPGILFLSDFHPFLFNGMGVAKRMLHEDQADQKTNRMLNLPTTPTRNSPPLILAYLDFSEHLLFEDPISIKIVKGEDLAHVNTHVNTHFEEEKVKELEEVWSVKLGKDSPVRANRVKVLGILSSNTFYWTSLVETLGKLYIVPREKPLRVEDYQEDRDEELDKWPELNFLSEEERRGLVMGYRLSSSFKGVRWANNQPIYFSPSLIFDYPNNLANISVIYLVPLAFVKGTYSDHLYFLPVIAFSGRLGISTMFSGNKELGFDFILTHSYPVKEEANIPYITMSSVIQAEIEEPRVRGTILSFYLKEKWIELIRRKEKLWSASTLYLRKGVTPIPGVRFSTIYLPLLLEEEEGGERFDAGNLESLSESLKGDDTLSKAPDQEELFPQYEGKEVYLVYTPFYNGEEVEFRERISDIISSSCAIVKKKKQHSGKTLVSAYVLREDIRQEAMAFPVVVSEERARALLTHQYLSPFRHLVGDNQVKQDKVRRVNRKSPVSEELYGYINFLPEETREAVRVYLSFLFKAIGGSGFVMEDIPPPPPPWEGLSVFALISEPAFHLKFTPHIKTTHPSGPGELPIPDFKSVPSAFTIEAYPYWKFGHFPQPSSGPRAGDNKERYLPSIPMVRFLRINHYQGPKGPGLYVSLFVFHRGEVSGIGEEGYPLNTMVSLII